MNLTGKNVTFLKLHGPIFFAGQQTGNTINSDPKAQNEGLKNVKMTVCDQGILLQTTGKDFKATKVISILITTYESATVDMGEEVKAVKK
jgi:hypothetical protein